MSRRARSMALRSLEPFNLSGSQLPFLYQTRTIQQQRLFSLTSRNTIDGDWRTDVPSDSPDTYRRSRQSKHAPSRKSFGKPRGRSKEPSANADRTEHSIEDRERGRNSKPSFAWNSISTPELESRNLEDARNEANEAFVRNAPTSALNSSTLLQAQDHDTEAPEDPYGGLPPSRYRPSEQGRPYQPQWLNQSAIPFDSGSATADPLADQDLSSISSTSKSAQIRSLQQPRTRKDTMTDTEREAFSNLFESLRKKEELAARQDLKKYSKAQSRHRNRPELKESSEGEPFSLDSIFTDLAKDAAEFEIMNAFHPDSDAQGRDEEPSQSGPARRATPAGSSFYRLRLLPDFLQQIARPTAAWFAERDAGKLLQQQQHVDAEDTSEGRSEMRRIEKLLHSPNTDLGIWQILEQELLPKIKSLENKSRESDQTLTDQHVTAANDSAVTTPVANRQSLQDRNTPENVAGKSATPEETSKPHSEKPVPYAAYPALTLYALRLLTTRFEYSPVPDALPILLKRYGITVFNLCASTSFYNVLLEYSFRKKDSASEVIRILDEMKSGGIHVNENTHGIMEEMLLYRTTAQRGELGFALKAIEDTVGRNKDYKELNERYRQIGETLRERALIRRQREEAADALRLEEMEEDKEDNKQEERLATTAASA